MRFVAVEVKTVRTGSQDSRHKLPMAKSSSLHGARNLPAVAVILPLNRDQFKSGSGSERGMKGVLQVGEGGRVFTTGQANQGQGERSESRVCSQFPSSLEIEQRRGIASGAIME